MVYILWCISYSTYIYIRYLYNEILLNKGHFKPGEVFKPMPRSLSK